MKILLFLVFILTSYLNASNIRLIDENYAKQMEGIAYQKECPVSLDDLRIVNVKYLGFELLKGQTYC